MNMLVFLTLALACPALALTRKDLSPSMLHSSSLTSADCAYNAVPTGYPTTNYGQHCTSWSNQNCWCQKSSSAGPVVRVFDVSNVCPVGETPRILTGAGFVPYLFSSGSTIYSQAVIHQGATSGSQPHPSWNFMQGRQGFAGAFDVPLRSDTNFIKLSVSPGTTFDPKTFFFWVDMQVLCDSQPISTVETLPRGVMLAGCMSRGQWDQSGVEASCESNQYENAVKLTHENDGQVATFRSAARYGYKSYQYTFTMEQPVVITRIQLSGASSSGPNIRSRLWGFSLGPQAHTLSQQIDAQSIALDQSTEWCQEDWSVHGCWFDLPATEIRTLTIKSENGCQGCVNEDSADAIVMTKVLAAPPNITPSAGHFSVANADTVGADFSWNAVLDIPAQYQQEFGPGWLTWEVAPLPVSIGAPSLIFTSNDQGASLSGRADFDALSGHTFTVTLTDGVNRISTTTISLPNSGCTSRFADNVCSTCQQDDGSCEFSAATLQQMTHDLTSSAKNDFSRWCSIRRFN